MHWIVCLLLLSSCAERHFSADDFQRHDNGAPKPKVAIVPVITPLDTLSEELTTCFLHRIRSTHKFYLTSDFSVLANYLTDLSEINPLVEDVRWLYENGSSSDFVVFLELVTHTLQPGD